MRCRSEPVPPLSRDVVKALPRDLQRRAALDGGRNAGPRCRRHDYHGRRLSGAEPPPERHPPAVPGDPFSLYHRDVLHVQLTLLMTDEPTALLLYTFCLSCGAAGLRLCSDAVNFAGCRC